MQVWKWILILKNKIAVIYKFDNSFKLRKSLEGI